MTISEMNKVLKEMKEICNFKDSETYIAVRSKTIDPCIYDEHIKLETTINGIDVHLFKDMNKKGE